MEGRQVVGAVFGTVIKVVAAAVIIMFVYKYAVIAYDYGYRIFAEEAMEPEPGRDVSITVSDNYDAKDLGKLLEEEGLIHDANLFVIQELLFTGRAGLAPGTYELNTAMSVEEMLNIMISKAEETGAEE